VSHPPPQPIDNGPPHSDASELALLRSIVQGCDLRGADLEGLEPAHFYRAAHGWVFAAMREIVGNGQVVDLITLTERLKERDEKDFLIIDGKSGESALQALVEGSAGDTLAVRSYAKIIRTKHTRRMMIKQAESLAAMAHDEATDPGIQLARHERAIMNIKPFDLSQEFISGKDSASYHHNLLAAQAKEQTWHSMPFAALARRAPVLLNGDIAVIVGPEGSGKSALLAQWAQHEASQGLRSVYIHTEMNAKAVFDRRAANVSRGLPFSRLLRPDKLTEGDWAAIVETTNEIQPFSDNLDYWHAGTIPQARLFTIMQHMVDTFGTRAFFLDYLNDVEIERAKSDTSAVGWRALMAKLEVFANSNHVIVVTAAQLNKEGGAYEIGRALHQKVMLYLKIEPDTLDKEYPFRFQGTDYRYMVGDYCPVMPIKVEKYRAGGRGRFELLFVGPRYLWVDVPVGFKSQEATP
jgi:replicative DNA helicase